MLAQGYAGPAEVLRGWLESPDHRVTLLDPENTHIGPGFLGEHALAFAMPCSPAQNTSGDFGDPNATDPTTPGPPDPGTGDPDGSLSLSFTRPRVRGRTVYIRVGVLAGRGTLRLVARSGKRVVRGRPVAVVKRARLYRLAVRVSRRGRWRVSLRVNGRTARRFTVRARSGR